MRKRNIERIKLSRLDIQISGSCGGLGTLKFAGYKSKEIIISSISALDNDT